MDAISVVQLMEFFNDNLIAILSTRELAWMIWILIILIRFLFNRGIRESFKKLIGIFLASKILVSCLVFLFHTIFSVFILFKLGLWENVFFKDTLIWTLSFGFLSLMNVNEANDGKYFQRILLDSIKWTIAVEFMVNFFTFSLLVELIMVPILTLSVVMQVFASGKPEHKQVEKMFSYVLTGLGVFIFCFSLYKTIELHNQFFRLESFKVFLLPVLLTAAFIPFLYLYNLVVKYEVLWVRLNFSIRDKQTRRKVKCRIFWVANLNLEKLRSISDNIFKPINVYNDYSYEMVKKVSKGEYLDPH